MEIIDNPKKEKWKEICSRLISSYNENEEIVSKIFKDVETMEKMNGDLDTFSDVIRRLAKEFDTYLIDLRKIFMTYVAENNINNEAAGLLTNDGVHLNDLGNNKSAVIVVSGVNGVGKTTTIGKIGKFFKNNNKSVVFGAADTFRAAAIDQLELWARKIKVDIIKSETGSDPASVAFKTAEFTKKNLIDIALIDTAGRLQNKKNLMEEYKKIINVLKKIDSNYPNEIILVLDATTGQNALNQVEEFSKVHDLTGLIITKLDSTAKGGIILAICKKLSLIHISEPTRPY